MYRRRVGPRRGRWTKDVGSLCYCKNKIDKGHPPCWAVIVVNVMQYVAHSFESCLMQLINCVLNISSSSTVTQQMLKDCPVMAICRGGICSLSYLLIVRSPTVPRVERSGISRRRFRWLIVHRYEAPLT
jgi:hypothetical protein